ncbi:hypothetical protein N657DRAFT_647228 [Parathielavia appendiculata]|uniref:Uncharacterized protein n=1 Tax=Parathielavia appendiculata TaxID=2587402 RepID=A0AAN6TVY9_9PEZI|nr:hypothetical protein N657DRAFT_647228 [Parathielavia appendiculata]
MGHTPRDEMRVNCMVRRTTVKVGIVKHVLVQATIEVVGVATGPGVVWVFKGSRSRGRIREVTLTFGWTPQIDGGGQRYKPA